MHGTAVGIRARLIALLCGFSLLLGTPALAKLAPARLSQVTASAELIVVANVAELPTDADGQRFAILNVEGIWHGKAQPTVWLSLGPTGSCDRSSAVRGERAVFFLNLGADGLFHIVHAGNGRIPIEGEYALVPPLVLLPDESHVRSSDRRVQPSEFERMVKVRLAAQGA